MVKGSKKEEDSLREFWEAASIAFDLLNRKWKPNFADEPNRANAEYFFSTREIRN